MKNSVNDSSQDSISSDLLNAPIGASDSSFSKLISSVLNRHLVFVHGKGGVGKTAVSQAIALCLSKKGAKTLWVALEDPTRPPGELIQMGPSLWHLNCDFSQSFEEYSHMKIGVASIARIFLHNKLVRYLAKAAPGIHELVLLGKIWFERKNYSHIVVDLPSTGYGLAMFQSTENFIRLFHGGPLHRDAQSMMETFQNSQITGNLIVALPEEMPLRESLELNDYLKKIFPENPALFLVNRLFPALAPSKNPESGDLPPEVWKTPLAASTDDYIRKRFWLENFNLRLWREAEINFGKLGFVPPPVQESPGFLVERLAEQLTSKAYL